MLATLKVRYVIAGHSERRAQCGETDEVMRDKVDAIYRHAMRPILCVGETTGERHSGVAEKKVRRQVAAALGDRPAELVAAAVIAYEPLWAIGAGGAATPEEAEEMCAVIRDELEQLARVDAAAMVRIQYGGSVAPEISEAFARCGERGRVPRRRGEPRRRAVRRHRDRLSRPATLAPPPPPGQGRGWPCDPCHDDGRVSDAVEPTASVLGGWPI